MKACETDKAAEANRPAAVPPQADGRLRRQLYAQYDRHFRRVNPSLKKGTSAAPGSGESDRMLRHLYGRLLDAAPASAPLLDLGCGQGFLVDWLARRGTDVVGVDNSAIQIEHARRRFPQRRFLKRDGLDFLSNHPATYGGIFCNDLVEHIAGEDALLHWLEAARCALLPGGFFCCRVPNAANLTGHYLRYNDLTHVRSFARASLQQLLEAAGFDGVDAWPVWNPSPLGRLRYGVEYLLHRAVFSICGRANETLFSKAICGVGYRP